MTPKPPPPKRPGNQREPKRIDLRTPPARSKETRDAKD